MKRSGDRPKLESHAENEAHSDPLDCTYPVDRAITLPGSGFGPCDSEEFSAGTIQHRMLSHPITACPPTMCASRRTEIALRGAGDPTNLTDTL
jgi:hypothetical protein